MHTYKLTSVQSIYIRYLPQTAVPLCPGVNIYAHTGTKAQLNRKTIGSRFSLPSIARWNGWVFQYDTLKYF